MNLHKIFPTLLVLAAAGIVGLGLRKEFQERSRLTTSPRAYPPSIPPYGSAGRIIWRNTDGTTITAPLDMSPDGGNWSGTTYAHLGISITIERARNAPMFGDPYLFRYKNPEGKTIDRIIQHGDRGVLVEDGQNRVELVYP